MVVILICSVGYFEKRKILHPGKIDFQYCFSLTEIAFILSRTKGNRFDLQTVRKAQLKMEIIQRQWRQFHRQIQTGKKQGPLFPPIKQGAFHTGRGIGFQKKILS